MTVADNCLYFRRSSAAGFQIQWMDKPDGAITAQEKFDVTFQLIVADDFYTFAFNSGYFADIPGAS